MSSVYNDSEASHKRRPREKVIWNEQQRGLRTLPVYLNLLTQEFAGVLDVLDLQHPLQYPDLQLAKITKGRSAVLPMGILMVEANQQGAVLPMEILMIEGNQQGTPL